LIKLNFIKEINIYIHLINFILFYGFNVFSTFISTSDYYVSLFYDIDLNF
jgi:hypothetical protein